MTGYVSSNIALTEAEANNIFLKIQAQGNETFQNVIINGTTDINSLKVNNLLSNRVCITDGSYNLASSTITNAEQNNLLGCNSNIQTQIDDKPFVYNNSNGSLIQQPIIVIGTSDTRTFTQTQNFFSNTIFSSAPFVVGTCQRNANDIMIPAIFNITRSSFQHVMKRTNSGSNTGTLLWMAIGF
jgi:hypothetical protein